MYIVAPYVGAWIETRLVRGDRHPDRVAPYVGAWIETKVAQENNLPSMGRTLRGCVD